MGKLTSTHTHANLEVSAPTYEEIADKLRDADYGHVIDEDGTIDMHGIGLVPNGAPFTLGHLALVEVQKGDTLVILCPEPLSMMAVQRIQEIVRKRWPPEEGIEVLVLDSGLELGVVRQRDRD